ncbi:ArsR/SmtB family transcription factor [Bacillus marasmi]|uniref:ArsR/SmtB family transcription factor n=1 Tax=Bacillus marasmi TaxID=1926279 RepID=UPI0011CCB73F|nr:metalloregulator ArsR/SmtB family transcription factor [Bacillus marasmi]
MKEHDVCEVTCVDDEKVTRVRSAIKDHNTNEVAKIFKALSDDTRLKIAVSLTLEDELCVCDVANIIGSSVATASHHLRLLRNLGIAKFRKEGKLVYYSIDDEHVLQLIQLAFTHQKEVENRV